MNYRINGTDFYDRGEAEPTDVDQAIRDASTAIHRLYDFLAPDTADWLVTVANIQARKERR